MRVIPFCLAFLVVSGVCNHLSAQEAAPEKESVQDQVSSPDQEPAQDYKFAVGIRFSSASPTLSNSISIKYFLDETNALEGLVSYGNRFGLGALYERLSPAINFVPDAFGITTRFAFK